MPQFDTFSFFSQLFWTLTFFLIFFALVSYYLLPSIGIILKVRKRALLINSKSLTNGSLNDRISFVGSFSNFASSTPLITLKNAKNDFSGCIESNALVLINKLTTQTLQFFFKVGVVSTGTFF